MSDLISDYARDHHARLDDPHEAERAARFLRRARPRPTGEPPVAIFGDTGEPQPRGLIHWGWWVALQALLLLLLLGAVWVAADQADWAGSLDSIGYSLRHSATGRLP